VIVISDFVVVEKLIPRTLKYFLKETKNGLLPLLLRVLQSVKKEPNIVFSETR
jgi:hypothetical protein